MAFRLPRLPANYDNVKGLFERYWDEVLRAIENQFNALLALPVIEEAVAQAQSAAEAAQQAAEDAQNSANSATGQTEAQRSETSLVNSYVTGFTAPLITAAISGAVTIKPHSRVYGDSSLNPTVSVAGATIPTTGVSGDVIRVYYNDASRSGGTVTYLYTIDGVSPSPAQTGDTHSVGVVAIPVVGTSDGKWIREPGYVEL